MKDIASQVNNRPLSPGCTPNHGASYDDPIGPYKRWTIRKFTGWKGNTAIIEQEDTRRPGGCSICGRPLKPGDLVVVAWQADVIDHFECSEDPTKGQIIGQWLAYKGDSPESYVFAYASVPGAEGIYKRGASFDISIKDGQKALTQDTPQEEIEAAREEGFKRLIATIDKFENQ